MEELNALEIWNTISQEQAGAARRRPDLKVDDNGYYPASFYCALLQRIRPEQIREEPEVQDSSLHDQSYLVNTRASSDDESDWSTLPSDTELDTGPDSTPN